MTVVSRSEWDTRRAWARREAAEVLENYWDGTVPVDPIAIARRMGVESYYGDLGGNVSGKLEMRDGKATIFVDDDYPRRARFTVAHELGHYVDHRHDLDADVTRTDLRDGTSNPEEFGVNEFAGALLMPEDEFRRDVQTGWGDRALAHLYQVSPAAVRVRKQTLGL